MKKNYVNASAIGKVMALSLLLHGPLSQGQNVIKTICGTGVSGTTGDGGPATAATVSVVTGLYVDNASNVYLSGDEHKIRKINGSTGIITTIAGKGTAAYSGDGGPATAAELNSPSGITCDASGNMYVADVVNRRIRKITATTGIITTVAGGGSGGLIEGGPATSESTLFPTAVKFDKSGNMFIADCGGCRVRKVNASGIITTFAGDGMFMTYGDGGPATAAAINNPKDFCFDAAGNMYISEGLGNRIRKVNTSGIISTIAGTGTSGYSGDGGPATAAMMGSPASIEIDLSGNLIFADVTNHRIRSINLSTGIITTVAGTGIGFNSGDGGPATAAGIDRPQGLFMDAAGKMYISVTQYRVRKIENTSSLGVKSIAPFITSLYPNPSAGVFHLTFPDASQRTMEVVDATGRLVKSLQCNSVSAELNMTNQPNGVYYIKVAAGENINWQKVVVQH